MGIIWPAVLRICMGGGRVQCVGTPPHYHDHMKMRVEQNSVLISVTQAL